MVPQTGLTQQTQIFTQPEKLCTGLPLPRVCCTMPTNINRRQQLFHAFFNGAVMMSGLIVAIGAQNTFVLRQGLARQHALLVATVCWLCDVVLMAVGIGGVASAARQQPLLVSFTAMAGALFLLGYGLMALRRAWRGGRHCALPDPARTQMANKGKTVLLTLAVTLLNPHVYLDTVWLIGSVAAPLATGQKTAFWLGASWVSGMWFFGLALGARLLLPWFRRERVWQILDTLIALMMFYLAWGLMQPLWLA